MRIDATAALRDLLAEERAALLAGRLDALPDLAERKAACLADLDAAFVDGALKDAAEGNHRLLERSLAALKAARDRLAEIRRMAEGRGGYGADGRAQSIRCGLPSVGRRV